ncbi:MAG: hypothetical protein AB7O43_22550 [Hyphomicrobiaceae bacterium]
MILSVLRVLIGFALACLVAALVQLGFASPGDLFTTDIERLGWTGEQVLLVATHSGIFSAPFALIAAAIGEWQNIRSWVYYVLSAVAIAIAGFIAVYTAESPGPVSIVNAYALAAYLCAGLAAGLTYYAAAGRSAGEPADTASQSPGHQSPSAGAGKGPAETVRAAML